MVTPRRGPAVRQDISSVRQNISKLLGWFFGTLWATLAVSAVPRAYLGVACAIGVTLACLFLLRLWRTPSPGASKSLFKARAYLLAVTAEVVGIYAASSLLPRHGAQQQVLPAVGVIVGLHFIGLWIATRSARFLSITAGMCTLSLLSMLVPYTWHGTGARNLLLGLGNALVLWWNASSQDRA